MTKMHRTSEDYGLTVAPMIIKILLKIQQQKKNYSINLVSNCSTNDICNLLKKYNINYNLSNDINNTEKLINSNIIMFDYVNGLGNMNKFVELFIKNIKKSDDKSNVSNKSNVSDETNVSNVCEGKKLIFVFNKKKLLENILELKNFTCIDYYTDHNNSNKEYYCVINL